MSPAARRLAVIITVIAVLSLAGRVYISAGDKGGIGPALSYLSQFFTILTNAFVAIVMGRIGAGAIVSPRVTGAVTTAIVGVGIVYHLLLAGLRELSGLDLLLDHGVHTVVPLLTAIWFAAFARTRDLGWSDLPYWAIWPLVYCVYALARAQFSGFYPYFFMDLNKITPVQLLGNLIGLSLGFMTIGAALLLVTRLRQRQSG